jgi:hypothetical protein
MNIIKLINFIKIILAIGKYIRKVMIIKMIVKFIVGYIKSIYSRLRFEIFKININNKIKKLRKEREVEVEDMRIKYNNFDGLYKQFGKQQQKANDKVRNGLRIVRVDGRKSKKAARDSE